MLVGAPAEVLLEQPLKVERRNACDCREVGKADRGIEVGIEVFPRASKAFEVVGPGVPTLRRNARHRNAEGTRRAASLLHMVAYCKGQRFRLARYHGLIIHCGNKKPKLWVKKFVAYATILSKGYKHRNMNLRELPLGAKAKVIALSLEGAERRRLLDLGLAVGTIIEAVRRSPLGDPTAYRIRGAVVALREEQAERVEVEPCPA